VKLVGIQVPSAGLARGSQFTSTITGSIGWESLLIGKPCVTFGKPWYFACNSCYLVDSLEDARKAVADILSKGKAEVEADLLRWLAYQRDRFEQTSFEYDFAIKSPLGYDKLVGNLARRLAKEIEAGAPRPASQD
jgi:hypothetical protein